MEAEPAEMPPGSGENPPPAEDAPAPGIGGGAPATFDMLPEGTPGQALRTPNSVRPASVGLSGDVSTAKAHATPAAASGVSDITDKRERRIGYRNSSGNATARLSRELTGQNPIPP